MRRPGRGRRHEEQLDSFDGFVEAELPRAIAIATGSAASICAIWWASLRRRSSGGFHCGLVLSSRSCDSLQEELSCKIAVKCWFVNGSYSVVVSAPKGFDSEHGGGQWDSKLSRRNNLTPVLTFVPPALWARPAESIVSDG